MAVAVPRAKMCSREFSAREAMHFLQTMNERETGPRFGTAIS